MLTDTRPGVSYPAPASADAPPKTLIILLAALAGLLVVLGVVSAWSFSRVDALYGHLVERTVSDLSHVHDVAFHAGVGYAMAVQAREATDPKQRVAFEQMMACQRATNDQIYAELAADATDAPTRACLEDVKSKRSACRQVADAYLSDRNHPGDPATIAAAAQLFRAFVEYQASCDRLSDQIESNSLQARSAVAAEVHRMRSLFFCLGILPVVVACVLVVVMVFLIATTPPEVDLH